MHSAFIYAETAFHHEGDIDYLKQLVDAAAEAGVGGIKFQVLINFDDLISSKNPAYEMLKPYVFSAEQWMEIFSYTMSKGLSLVVMPLDTQSFDLINRYKDSIKYLEIHPVSFNDPALKQGVKDSGLDVVLGVGGRTQAEIAEAAAFFGTRLKVLMVGFQAFPSLIQEVRIRKISELKALYPGMAIGYADHSGYDDKWAIDSNNVAFALGATIFEKHLTLNEGIKRVDYESAVGIEKLKKIKCNLEELDAILFDNADAFEMTAAEERYRNRQKMVVASRDLVQGTLLTLSDLALKMTGSSDGLASTDQVVGKILDHAVSKDSLIKLSDVSA